MKRRLGDGVRVLLWMGMWISGLSLEKVVWLRDDERHCKVIGIVGTKKAQNKSRRQSTLTHAKMRNDKGEQHKKKKNLLL